MTNLKKIAKRCVISDVAPLREINRYNVLMDSFFPGDSCCFFKSENIFKIWSATDLGILTVFVVTNAGALRIQVPSPKLQALQLARTKIYRQTKNRVLLEKGVSHHLTYF